MEILTREGRILGSLLEFTSLWSTRCLSWLFSAFLLRKKTGSLSAPCFDHFLSDMSRGSAITSHRRVAKNEVRLLRGRAGPTKDASQPSVRMSDGAGGGGHGVKCAPDAEMGRMMGGSPREEGRSPGKGGGLHRSWDAARDDRET